MPEITSKQTFDLSSLSQPAQLTETNKTKKAKNSTPTKVDFVMKDTDPEPTKESEELPINTAGMTKN